MTLLTYMQSHRVFLDGGTGTLLQEAGLPAGTPTEKWNVSHKDELISIHKAYYDAGSNVVSTNTFGVNALKYGEDEIRENVSAAVQNVLKAKELSAGKQEKFVALDIGPLGKLLKPLGNLEFEYAVGAFAPVIRAGAEAGADLVFIETMNDSYETKAALLAAKENCDLPVFVSNAYGRDGRLMSGADPLVMTAILEGMGADAIGVNCSLGPKALSPIVGAYLKHASVPVICKPNAGLPRIENGRTVFDVSPEEFAEQLKMIADSGANVLGGCCGTTPEHIRALVRACEDLPYKPVSFKNETVISSGVRAVDFRNAPILIGERINPTGKKRLKEALAAKDMQYVLNEALNEEEKGADVLDVNVGAPEVNEKELLPLAIREIQAVTSLPLQLDTSDPLAMENALRVYNGKPLVNSVNGKEEIMRAIFPLAKKYGGVIVALTLDESGIPDTADGRVKIAEKILKRAEEYGIRRSDIVFDPLTLTVSADPNAALVTLSALRAIRRNLGCHTLLGVSNVSFGLPERNGINSVFFTSALENGLSAAIMNPYSVEMMNSYHAWKTLNGLDPNCAGYIAFASANASGDAKTASAPKISQTPCQTLSDAIQKGMKDEASRMTDDLLADHDPLSVVETEIIPALNEIGRQYEQGKAFLPQLLMSAEASGCAFERIKSAMQGSGSATNGVRIVLATVKGDVHDIGKNIVRLLLENYGFEVTDLGKDVEPEKIVDAVLRLRAPLCGLSALMTTTVPMMEETIGMLHKKAPFCKIVVGGAVLTKEYAEKIGADRYAPDAMSTVHYAQQFISEG